MIDPQFFEEDEVSGEVPVATAHDLGIVMGAPSTDLGDTSDWLAHEVEHAVNFAADSSLPCTGLMYTADAFSDH